jgi:large subunit ribosomal protein L25
MMETAMSDVMSLAAATRAKAGKGASRAVRLTGQVPAVIYGAKQAPDLISVSEKSLMKLINTGHFFTAIVELDVDGKVQRGLVRDIAQHPVSDRVIHVDFLRVNKDTRVRVKVPVHFKDEAESPGLKRGGMLNIVRHEVELECPAEQIPAEIVTSVKGLDVGVSIHISAFHLPEGVRSVIRDRDFTVATIIAPSGMKSSEEATAEGAAAAAAPAKGKAPAAKAAAPAAKPAAKK